MGRVYKSKVDAWLVLVLIVPVIIIAAIVSSWASRGDPHFSTTLLVSLAIPLLVGTGLPLWLFLNTAYTIGPENLVVQCGPMRSVVPLRSITRVTPSRSIESAPALSLDRLAIEYGAGRRLVISPKDKPGFVAALVEAREAATPIAAATPAAH